jgi:uncharacterized protein YegL
MENMDGSLELVSTLYRGNLGQDGDSNILVTNINVVKTHPSDGECPCRVIFVIDCSGSMAGERINTVKAGLLAIRSLMTLASRWDSIESHIITFSDSAEHIWDSTSNTKSYDDVVTSISVKGATDLESGLRLALSVTQKSTVNKPTWVIAMTDGEANLGQLSSIFFTDMYKKFSTWVKTITIGIGDTFSDDLLKPADHMTHAKDLDTIHQVMGSVISDMDSIFAVNAKLTHADTNYERVVGTDKIGFLVSKQTYTEMNILSDISPEIVTAKLSTTDPVTGKATFYNTYAKVVNENLPLELQRIYFQSQSAKMIEEINKKSMSSLHSRNMKIKLERWKSPVSTPFRASVLETLSKWSEGELRREDRYQSACLSKCTQTQRAYGVKSNGIYDLSTMVSDREMTAQKMMEDAIQSHL